MTTWAVVVAAGRGTRFGAVKQFEVLAGRRLLDLAVDAARAACDGVIVVGPHGIDLEVADATCVTGGDTRSDSVRAGLDAVPADVDVIVIHDAARPLAPVALFDDVIGAVLDGVDGAVPGLAVTDTVKEIEGNRVVRTLARDRLVAVQTPQAFRASKLRAAYATGAVASDDAALVEDAGGSVVVVGGDPRAMKVTTTTDLVALRALAGG